MDDEATQTRWDQMSFVSSTYGPFSPPALTETTVLPAPAGAVSVLALGELYDARPITQPFNPTETTREVLLATAPRNDNDRSWKTNSSTEAETDDQAAPTSSAVSGALKVPKEFTEEFWRKLTKDERSNIKGRLKSSPDPARMFRKYYDGLKPEYQEKYPLSVNEELMNKHKVRIGTGEPPDCIKPDFWYSQITATQRRVILKALRYNMESVLKGRALRKYHSGFTESFLEHIPTKKRRARTEDKKLISAPASKRLKRTDTTPATPLVNDVEQTEQAVTMAVNSGSRNQPIVVDDDEDSGDDYDGMEVDSESDYDEMEVDDDVSV